MLTMKLLPMTKFSRACIARTERVNTVITWIRQLAESILFIGKFHPNHNLQQITAYTINKGCER